MAAPDRPAGVPPEAVWDPKDEEWQLGTFRRRGRGRGPQHPVGEWRYFRRDGSLCCVTRFDDEGALHGVHERFHPDGTLASRGEWEHGNRAGRFVHVRSSAETPEEYPASEATWRYEFASTANWQEDDERWFLADGRECTADGRPLESAYDLDPVLEAAGPESYLERHAEAVATAFRGGAPATEPPVATDPLSLADLWGSTVPEIDRFVALGVDGDHFARVTTCRRFEGNDNVWEALIAHPWGNRLEELGAVFMAAARIGTFGDSDSVYATLFQPRRDTPRPNAVYLWSHETDYADDVLALSLDAFAFRTAVAAASAAQRLSPRTAASAWRKLAGQTHTGWAASSGLDALEPAGEGQDGEDSDDGENAEGDSPHSERLRETFVADLDPQGAIRGFFWRAQWILQLLRPDAERDWSAVQECFFPGWNLPYDDAGFEEEVQRGARLPQTAIYLLWRSFWFDQPERFQACRAAYADHPARMVRDLVSLIDGLVAGRAVVGGIADFMEVRRRFLALDLLPERAPEREREAAAAAAREEARLSALASSLGPEPGAAGDAPSLEHLLDLAWASVDDAAAIQVIERTARAIPGLEPQWRAFEWVRRGGFERGGTTCLEEVEGVGVWLGRNRDLLPFVWAWARSDGNAGTAAVLLPAMVVECEGRDPRLAAACVAALDVVEAYNHRRELAVRLLGLMDERSALPRLCRLVDEYRAAISGKSDFEERMASIPWDGLVLATAEALGRLGGTDVRAREALLWILRRALRASDWRLAAASLGSLVEAGETALLPEIRSLLTGSNDDEGRLAALRAIERLAGSFPAAERTEMVEEVFRNPADHDNAVTLLFHRAARALAAADPSLPVEVLEPSEMLEAARDLTNYGRDGWRGWRLLECETVGRFPELPLSALDRHLRSADSRVRGAAEAAYLARGVSPPERRVLAWPEIWRAVDDASGEAASGDAASPDAASAVARLLTDPTSVDRAAAAGWLWENPSEAGAVALAAVVQAELDDFVAPGPGDSLSPELTWLIRALLRHADFSAPTGRPAASLGGGAGAKLPAAIERSLAFDDDEVARTVCADLGCLPARYAPAVLALAVRHADWRRGAAARWAFARKGEPAVAAALKAASIPPRKLQAWAR